MTMTVDAVISVKTFCAEANVARRNSVNSEASDNISGGMDAREFGAGITWCILRIVG